MVFENKVLGRLFGPHKDEVTGGRRKSHNSIQFNSSYYILCTKYYWEDQIKEGRGMQPAYKILVGKPEGKRPLGKPRCRWEIL
jgi:hypothetical protein